MKHSYWILCCFLFALLGCREEYEILYASQTQTEVEAQGLGELKGFYLLNEGNMGSNKAEVDYFDFAEGLYYRNIYAEANPTVVKELGDVGNDIRIYGSKLYAAINVSNYIEVMDAHTAKHIGTVEIPNVRYIGFHGGRAYATSYVAPGQLNEAARVGCVTEIDTATLEIIRTVEVGYQPEEFAFAGNKIYVANSGGYLEGGYERTVSVIDIATFKEVRKIEAGINLHRIRATAYNELLVSSRGDHWSEPSHLLVIDLNSERVTQRVDIPVSNFDIAGDSAYICAARWNRGTQQNEVTYGILDIRTKEVVSRNFITDGTDRDIVLPYGIKVNPVNGDVYITDAIDYVTPGTLFCYSREGRLKWKVDTGDIPAHIAFLYE